jgi:hypothetical protein
LIFSSTSGAIQYGLPLNEKGQCCPLIWEKQTQKGEKKINKLRSNDVRYGYRKKTTSKIVLPFPTFHINILTMKKEKKSKQTNYSIWFKIYANLGLLTNKLFKTLKFEY